MELYPDLCFSDYSMFFTDTRRSIIYSVEVANYDIWNKKWWVDIIEVQKPVAIVLQDFDKFLFYKKPLGFYQEMQLQESQKTLYGWRTLNRCWAEYHLLVDKYNFQELHRYPATPDVFYWNPDCKEKTLRKLIEAKIIESLNIDNYNEYIDLYRKLKERAARIPEYLRSRRIALRFWNNLTEKFFYIILFILFIWGMTGIYNKFFFARSFQVSAEDMMDCLKVSYTGYQVERSYYSRLICALYLIEYYRDDLNIQKLSDEQWQPLFDCLMDFIHYSKSKRFWSFSKPVDDRNLENVILKFIADICFLRDKLRNNFSLIQYVESLIPNYKVNPSAEVIRSKIPVFFEIGKKIGPIKFAYPMHHQDLSEHWKDTFFGKHKFNENR